ncbi:hypothetical protein L6452_19300 [Arctium lappa]|uniref:Uncharacterized protein n=1 Tax=Arctium lappa TaxID=4217 RepID=A0ACB9B7T2_ARCLA|nr:hypothetical protein L6452_19300 [Arctium lappa]
MEDGPPNHKGIQYTWGLCAWGGSGSAFVNHFQSVLGNVDPTIEPAIPMQWFSKKLSVASPFWLARRNTRWSWVLTKLMDLRPSFRSLFWFQLGDGKDINAWQDTWLSCGHLSSIISYRVASSVGILALSSVRDFLHAVHDSWSLDWVQRYTPLANVDLPPLHEGDKDKLVEISE